MNKSPAAGATETIDSEIASNILKALKAKGDMTQEDLAQELGVSYTTLRRSLEQHRNDRRSFSILELGKIADILDVHPSALFPPALTVVAA